MEIMRECTGTNLKEKVLAMTIEELNFSPRTFHCLKCAGIGTVYDLTQLVEDELYRVERLGKKGSEEVSQKLRGLGLFLRAPEKEKAHAMTIEASEYDDDINFDELLLSLEDFFDDDEY